MFSAYRVNDDDSISVFRRVHDETPTDTLRIRKNPFFHTYELFLDSNDGRAYFISAHNNYDDAAQAALDFVR